MECFPDSELIINSDNSIFHLHLKPEQLADNVILVGDPGRVEMVSSFFNKIESRSSNREFVSATGTYNGKRITVQSTGIGTDNIDIVLNELDALKNIDFKTRTEKEKKKSLNIVRVGTCGGLQEDLPAGTFLISEKSLGFDGTLNFYKGRDNASDIEFEKAFCEYMKWPEKFAIPYVTTADKSLVERISESEMKTGVTISANGFYGPQGRKLRLSLARPDLNEKIRAFRYKGYRITNYEMESAAVAGLSYLMGHKAMTVCLVIANRFAKTATTDYHNSMKKLIKIILERI